MKISIFFVTEFSTKRCQKHRQSTQLAESVRSRILKNSNCSLNSQIQIGLTEPELLNEIPIGLTQGPGLRVGEKKIG